MTTQSRVLRGGVGAANGCHPSRVPRYRDRSGRAYCPGDAERTRPARDTGHHPIGFACTNTPPLVALPGGRTPTLRTNPFAYGLPTGRYPPWCSPSRLRWNASVCLRSQNDVPLHTLTTSWSPRVGHYCGPCPPGCAWDKYSL